MSDALVRVADLTFGYPGAKQPVFRGLDLNIAEGEFVALVGGSGVGKSTLLRNVAGLVPATSGRIQFARPCSAGRRDTAFVFQDTRLLPWRRVRANVGYGLTGLKLSADERHARIDETLRLTAMTDYGDRWPHAVSGGQAQRVGLARALAVRPRLLLMDEPFSAVDALTRQHLQDQLIEIWQRLGMAVLFVTHDIEEAAYLADRVCVMRGSPAEIVHDETVAMRHPRNRNDNDFRRFTQRVANQL
ncbi:MAG: ABC transporter ATP-binding protein [Salinisphaera sp.]|jgi:NitT/TauT family transport system ATP-binding protein|nr:ABC transporter ATP-binding protein [Salinisphaera sp.]